MTYIKKYGSELVIPWDNDDFSLDLDDFPYSILARTKSNMYPFVRSPLRQQWNTVIDDEEEEDQTHPSKQQPESKRKSIQARIRSLSVKRRAHSSFPYNNSAHGRNPGNVEQDAIMVKKTSVSKPRGHVQHISPLMSLSSFSEGSTASLPVMKKTLSGVFVARPQSVAASETASIQSMDSTETWKVSQKSVQPGVIVPLTSRSTSPPISVTSTRIESAPPSVVSSVQSYQSVSVPNNADKLMFFEEVPPSPKSTFSQQFQSGFDIKNSVYIYDADMLKKKKKKQSPFLHLKNWFLHKST
jgi:hypothetical protein